MKVFKVRDVKDPVRGTMKSAGIDIFVPNDLVIKSFNHVTNKFDEKTIDNDFVYIQPGDSFLIPSGLKFNVPKNTALIAMNKSGIASKYNIILGACVIDEDYLGEIHIDIKNIGKVPVKIEKGMKITQLLCIPVKYTKIQLVSSEEECFSDKIKTSFRGTGGFGSTGK